MSAARTSATLEQVASLAGVSRSTVSRVINDSPKVSPAARAAVERAIAQLGYVPNPAARTLVTRRTGSVALVVRETQARIFGEPFFAGMLRSIGTAVAEADLQLVLAMAGEEEGDARLERFLFGGHVDGALLLSLHGADPLPVRAVERGLPVVVGGRPTVDHPAVTSVDADNVAGGRLATEHLLARGRRRIGAVTGPLDMVAGRDRLAGYHAALAAADVPVDDDLVVPADFTREGGRAATVALLARCPTLDAVVAASDLAAAGVLDALRAAGRRVPADVAVTGFDDSTTATSVEPALTTVRQDLAAMGAAMVRLLTAQIAGDDDAVGARLVLPTELVVRSST